MENGKVDKLKEFHSNTCTHHRDKRVNYSFWSITIISVFLLQCWKKKPSDFGKTRGVPLCCGILSYQGVKPLSLFPFLNDTVFSKAASSLHSDWTGCSVDFIGSRCFSQNMYEIFNCSHIFSTSELRYDFR